MHTDVRDESFAQVARVDTVPPDQVARVVRSEPDRGRVADRPTDIPRRGLRDVLARVRSEAKLDHVTLLSAGIAFYALLALVPALVAVISVYGLVASAADVRRQILDALSAAPREVRDLVSTQLESIASSSGASTIVAVVVGILAAVWSASAGVGHLIDALNVAYDEEETRGAVRRKATALAFTFGAVVFVAVAFVVIALLPPLVAHTGLGVVGRVVIGVVRWVVLLGGMQVALSVLYRYGPDRDAAKWRWVSPGASIAAGMWIVGSLVFSIYTANFAKYNETYGSLGAVVVLMLWLFLTALAVLVGAEVNAEMERQTSRDTTAGAPQSLGHRNAYAADTVGETAAELRDGHRRTEPAPGPASMSAEDASQLDGDRRVVERSISEFSFRIVGIVGLAARVFGVRNDRARATVLADTLEVRYGRWVLTTALSNISDIAVTGPYRPSKVAGPPRLTFTDAGLTFATNDECGVCISFHDPVSGLLPFGLLPHPNLTFTVDQPDTMAEHLRRVCPALDRRQPDATNSTETGH